MDRFGTDIPKSALYVDKELELEKLLRALED